MTQASSVFVVDSDQAVRSALRLLVSSYGLPVYTYDSTEEFLAACNDNTPSGCLILDLHAPADMNGVQLQYELQQRGIQIPTIIITAFPDSGLAEQARQAGALAVLPKPFSEADLRQHLQTAVEGLDAST